MLAYKKKNDYCFARTQSQVLSMAELKVSFGFLGHSPCGRSIVLYVAAVWELDISEVRMHQAVHGRDATGWLVSQHLLQG